MDNMSNETKKPIYFGRTPEKKYLIIPSLDTIAFDKKDYAKSVIELENFVNTEAVLKRLLFIFNDLVLLMARNGIEFDQISLSSSSGIVGSESYYNELKKVISGMHTDFEVQSLLTKLPDETCSDLVPVSFKIDFDLTGKNDNGLNLDLVKPEVEKKLSEYEVNGLVHLNEFLVGLRDLGLTVNSVDGELFSYEDYMNMLKENAGRGTWFSVETYYHNRKAQDDSIKL